MLGNRIGNFTSDYFDCVELKIYLKKGTLQIIPNYLKLF